MDAPPSVEMAASPRVLASREEAGPASSGNPARIAFAMDEIASELGADGVASVGAGGGQNGDSNTSQLVERIIHEYVIERRSTPKIARRVQLSPATVQSRLRSAGVELRPPGPGKVSRSELEATRDSVVAEYLAGRSTYAIAEDRPISQATVCQILHDASVEMRLPGRGRLTESEREQLAKVVASEYPEHSLDKLAERHHRSVTGVVGLLDLAGVSRCAPGPRRKLPEPEERKCLWTECRRPFRPRPKDVARDRGNFCSPRCWAKHRAHRGLHGVRAFVHDGWSREKRQHWEHRWNGYQGAPYAAVNAAKKGEKAALETIDLALKAVQVKPDLDRRQLIEALMKARDPNALLDPDGRRRSRRDPEYRKARKVIERQLDRGFKLRGSPRELTPLFAR